MSRRMRFFPRCTLALMLLVPILLLACGSDAPAATAKPTAALSATPTTASSGATLAPTATATTGATPTTASSGATAAPRATPTTASSGATPKPPLAETSSEADREALVALYNATGSPGWYRSKNWLSDAPIGEWHGVTTDGSGRVTHLDLEGNQLSGEIPPGTRQPRQSGKPAPLR